ncbi:importin subunit alpha-4 [Drosophila ficusphila]|uniref:importin subunit alpha-4 n=1 Tax=Drosophila ficusphila TaxID=30025 RepID=UPI0007E86D8D|nr:importin subunit alpha-4 [Drosophila ficusphila]XP_017048657.1 importin subunit alpha-4 [Drosophila ficusphila]
MDNHRRKFLQKGITKPQLRWIRQANSIQFQLQKRADAVSKKPSLDRLKNLVKAVYRAGNQEEQKAAAVAACSLLCTDDVPDARLLSQSKVLKMVVEFLKEVSLPFLQKQAANALCKVACASSGHASQILNLGAVPLLMDLLNSQDPEVCEQALAAVGNIIGYGPSYTPFSIEPNLVEKLSIFVKQSSFLGTVAKVTRNLCGCLRMYSPVELINSVIQTLDQLLNQTGKEIRRDTLLAIGNIAHHYTHNRILSAHEGLMSKILFFLLNNEFEVQKAALYAIDCILSGPKDQHRVLLDLHLLLYLPALLSHSKESIRMKTLSILFSISSGNKDQKQAIVDAGLLPPLLEIMKVGKATLKSAAVLVISNLIIGNNLDLSLYLIRQGIIPKFCTLLSCQDSGVIRNILDCLRYMLGMSGTLAEELTEVIRMNQGIEKIKTLQFHEDFEVRSIACQIIFKYDSSVLSPFNDPL